MYALDGYRPVNKAIYNACIRADDLWVTKTVERNDVVGLRNLLWNKMEGDNESQHTITAMQAPMNFDDHFYRFQSHGIDKYFAGIHSKLDRLKNYRQNVNTLSYIQSHGIIVRRIQDRNVPASHRICQEQERSHS